MKDYHIIWSEQAVKKLQSIYDYIYQDSPYQAQKVVDQILDCVEPLKRFPQMGARVRELSQHDLRELTKYEYRIVYQILDNSEIQIVTIIHSRQDFRSAFDRQE